jgi:hypothetical protein
MVALTRPTKLGGAGGCPVGPGVPATLFAPSVEVERDFDIFLSVIGLLGHAGHHHRVFAAGVTDSTWTRMDALGATLLFPAQLALRPRQPGRLELRAKEANQRHTNHEQYGRCAPTVNQRNTIGDSMLRTDLQLGGPGLVTSGQMTPAKGTSCTRT